MGVEGAVCVLTWHMKNVLCIITLALLPVVMATGSHLHNDNNAAYPWLE